MRSLLLVLFFVGTTAGSAIGQDLLVPESYLAAGATPLRSYNVMLTEFRLNAEPNAKLSADEIVSLFERSKDNDAVQIVETLRLTALQGHETVVQVGRNTAVTVGVVNSGRGQSRQMQTMSVGTLVKLTAESKDGKTLLILTYESSRLGEEKSEESQPDVSNFQVSTSLLLEDGKTVLAGGSQSATGSFLVVSIK